MHGIWMQDATSSISLPSSGKAVSVTWPLGMPCSPPDPACPSRGDPPMGPPAWPAWEPGGCCGGAMPRVPEAPCCCATACRST